MIKSYLSSALNDVALDPFWYRIDSLANLFDQSCEDYSRRFRSETTDDGFKLWLDLPGFKREEVSVELERGLLTVTAKGRYRFTQTVNVGQDIDVDKTTATLEAGVLALSFVRSEASRPRRIEIGT